MPTLTRDDGAEIHWEERGEGPLVVISPHVTGHPSVFEPLIEELGPDHRIVTYDARGTGRSTRTGPHDVATGAGDLAAVIAVAGGGAVVICLTEGGNRAVRVAAESPELAVAVVGAATAPISRGELRGAEALVGSDAVLDAFLDMVATDYRGALRTVMSAGNPQMSEDEVRRRVQAQVEYCPQEVAATRLRAWLDDDPIGFARQLGERLILVYSPQTAGAWFPAAPEMRRLIARLLPEAGFEIVEDGVVSRPDLTAGVVRRVSQRARLQSGA